MVASNPIAISSYGTIEKRLKSLRKLTLREVFSVGNLATFAFVLIDFVVLFGRWQTVQTDNWYNILLISIACAMILDIPMYLAAKTLVEYFEGLKSKLFTTITIALSVTCFTLVFAFSMYFSVVTKDATFQDPSASTMVNNIAAYAELEETESKAVLVAALYSGVLPLGTSIASFVIGLLTTHPLEDKLAKIQQAKLLANMHKIHINKALAEADAMPNQGEYLLKRDVDLYHQYIDASNSQGAKRKQSYRTALEERCDSDGINRVTESAQQVNEEFTFNEAPSLESYSFVYKAPVLEELREPAVPNTDNAA